MMISFHRLGLLELSMLNERFPRRTDSECTTHPLSTSDRCSSDPNKKVCGQQHFFGYLQPLLDSSQQFAFIGFGLD
jgi:hypothetical protein